jgi:hypothetical protein
MPMPSQRGRRNGRHRPVVSSQVSRQPTGIWADRAGDHGVAVAPGERRLARNDEQYPVENSGQSRSADIGLATSHGGHGSSPGRIELPACISSVLITLIGRQVVWSSSCLVAKLIWSPSRQGCLRRLLPTQGLWRPEAPPGPRHQIGSARESQRPRTLRTLCSRNGPRKMVLEIGAPNFRDVAGGRFDEELGGPPLEFVSPTNPWGLHAARRAGAAGPNPRGGEPAEFE